MLQIKRVNNKLYSNEALFFLAYGVYITFMLLRESMFVIYLDGYVYKLLVLSCFGIIIAKEWKYGDFFYLTVLAVAMVGGFSLIVKSAISMKMTLPLFLIFSARDIDIKKILKITLVISVVVLGFVILCSKAGIIDNIIRYDKDNRVREYLGFRYALFPSAIFLNIILMTFAIYEEKVNLIVIAFLSVGSLWMYKKTDSRLSLIMSGITIALIMCIKAYKRIDKRQCKSMVISTFFKTLVSGIFLLCYYVSMKCLIGYSSDGLINPIIKKIFGSRLKYGHEAYLKYGLSLFGKRIKYIGYGLSSKGVVTEGEYLYVDNLYLQFTQRYGLVMAVMMLMLMTYVMYKCIKKKKYVFAYIFVTIALRSVMDDLCVHIWYNPFLLLILSNQLDMLPVRKGEELKCQKRKVCSS